MSSTPQEFYKPKDFDGQQESELNEKEVVDDLKTNNKQEVDINAFFEKSEVDEKTQTLYNGLQMEDQNEANRKQLHFKRRLYSLIGVLVLMFFVGLIVTIIGSICLNREEREMNRKAEHESFAESLVDYKTDTNPIEAFIEPNMSSLDGEIDLNDVVVHSNDLSPSQKLVPTTAPTTRKVTTERTTTEFDYMPFERELQELAPDTSLQRFLNRLRNSRSELRLHDIPPAVDDVMQYIRRVFTIPQIRFEFH